jgi:hypothetical protein
MRKRTACISTTLITVFLIFWNIPTAFPQQFTDELIAKLPKPYQYKILKAETFTKKGVSFLEKGGKAPSEQTLADTTLSEKEEEKIDNYYINRIKAAYCFRDANGITYGVLDKFIKEFWDKFKGDKETLGILIKIENAAYDSLLMADALRAKAEKEEMLIDKVPLVSHAEIIETKALFKLEKVLFAYMNWPDEPNIPWLFSEDKTNPRNLNAEKEIQLSSIQLEELDSYPYDTVPRATSIYSLLQISTNQIDSFNTFLRTKYPTKAESYLIDFRKLNESVIDSLHKKWREYSFGGKLGADTVQSKLFAGINSKKSSNDEDQSSKGFSYKVQIAASRLKISNDEIKKIYSEKEKVTESFEDNRYKYTIGSFKHYKEAHVFLSSINVKGAFVIAYYNGKRIKITTDMVEP